MKKLKRKILQAGDSVLKGRYEILKLISNKGMANVYLVLDKSLRKQWCLKEILLTEAGKNKIELRSLVREANIMKGLSHPAIPRIVTMESEGDSLFIVMDFVDGVSLQAVLDQKKRLSEQETVTWSQQIASVLGYLHSLPQPVIYRDMKPANVMIQSDGHIRLLDFGISEIISPENPVIKEAVGTKGYAPPEQTRVGVPYDLRSDIYSLGLTMYYMLTGVNPAVYPTRTRSIREVDESLSKGLDYIIRKCTEPDPNYRYQSIEELMYDLQNYKKLDGTYKKRLRKKLHTIVWCFVLAAGMFLGSFVPQFVNTSETNSAYNETIETAEYSGKLDDYIRAISYKPDDSYAYLSAIDTIKTDGVFSSDEEQALMSVINANLNSIKDKDWYPEVANALGKLYWFYYDGTESGSVLSLKWFEDVKNLAPEIDEGRLYYQLASFEKNIAKSIEEANDTGMYKEYWDNLLDIQDTPLTQVMELDLYKTILSFIDTYSYRLKTDGVAQEDILEEIDKIKLYLDSTTVSAGRAEDIYNELLDIIDALPDKVEISYAARGQEKSNESTGFVGETGSGDFSIQPIDNFESEDVFRPEGYYSSSDESSSENLDSSEENSSESGENTTGVIPTSAPTESGDSGVVKSGTQINLKDYIQQKQQQASGE